MPELPEVETIRLDLERLILGRRLKDVVVRDSRVVREQTAKEFIQTLVGKSVQSVSRRGKALILVLQPQGFLVVQPMMTGQFLFLPDSQPAVPSSATKIIFHFADGNRLFYNDHRLFGRLFCTPRLADVKFLRNIGPEPLEKDFSLFWLTEQLSKRKLPIKSFLMNQSFLAGIGNIYASEILFRSRIHPERPAQSLRTPEIRRLFQMIPKVLREAIASRGTSMLTYRDAAGERGKFLNRIQVYGRDQENCRRCRSLIQKIVQSGRSTFFCGTCQS